MVYINTFPMDNFPETKSPYWMEMVDFILHLAMKESSLDDVNRALFNRTSKPGRNFQDYDRTLQKLRKDGLIYVDNQKIYVGSINKCSWIKQGIEKGIEQIWSLAEKIEPNKDWARKYDNTEIVEIGRIGEEAVVNSLRDKIDERYHNLIKHVSLFDDTKGYDVSTPSTKNHDKRLNLEIKTTVKQTEEFTFYLSRNEFNVGSKSKNWSLVFVKIKNDIPLILGHISLNAINNLFPIEKTSQAKWQVLKIKIPISIITPELP